MDGFSDIIKGNKYAFFTIKNDFGLKLYLRTMDLILLMVVQYLAKLS